jgi:membrane protein
MATPRLKELAARVARSRTLGLAAEMSFWLFLALIPLAFVAGFMLAKLAMSGAGLAKTALLTAPAATRELIVDQVGKVAAWRTGTVAPTAIVVFVWLASSGVHATFNAMEVEVGCSRPWWKKRAIALATCLFFSLGAVVLTVLGTGLDWVWRLAGTHVPVVAVASSSLLGRVTRLALGVVVVFVLTLGLFAIGVPRSSRRQMPIVPGALLAAALESVMGLGYALYVARAGAAGAYLGGLASIGVTMMTLYLFSVALLVGLELNVVLRDEALPRAR